MTKHRSGLTQFRITLFRWTLLSGEIAFDLEAFRELVLLLFRNLTKAIMSSIDELNDKVSQLESTAQAANDKADTVITALGDVRQQLADLQGSAGATPEQIQAVIDRIDAVNTGLSTQIGEDDTAVAGGAPAGDGSGG